MACLTWAAPVFHEGSGYIWEQHGMSSHSGSTLCTGHTIFLGRVKWGRQTSMYWQDKNFFLRRWLISPFTKDQQWYQRYHLSKDWLATFFYKNFSLYSVEISFILCSSIYFLTWGLMHGRGWYIQVQSTKSCCTKIPKNQNP
jgi:hypothetical protein